MILLASPLAAVLALASAASAAPAVASSTATATGVPAPKSPYWLKTYSTAPVQEAWSAVLTVKNLDADLPRVLKAISAAGGATTQAPSAFVSSKANHTQQLVLTVARERAQGLLKAWRRFGDLPTPQILSPGVSIPADEVRAKIDRLMKERVDRAADLAKLPVALEIEDEVLEHLLLVEEVARNGPVAVRVDLVVRQR